ncbi:ATP-binding protein [Kitasatospora sp. Root187]|uniref:ATP-binding protein n=1 Tax=Kitasatospora sp. Root187 TaxID=1736486 RepID=UPI0012F82B28|nr:ATP-binding protein [Kitasatospora sp. Root187]
MAPNAVVLDAALLIVTELAVNCVRHAAGNSPNTELILDFGGGNLQVAVADTHPWVPGTLPASGGLRVIDDLVRDFDGHLIVNLADTGPGKTIRVVLPVTAS